MLLGDIGARFPVLCPLPEGQPDDRYNPVFYDLITTDGRALSPWCWHARMALAHKGIAVDRREHCFTDKQQMIDAGGKSFPLLVDDNGSVHDRFFGYCHASGSHRPEPTLFPGNGVAAYRFMHRYVADDHVPHHGEDHHRRYPR